MEDNNKDLTQDNLVDDLIQSLYGFSDEQLLKEFEEAEQDTTTDPNIQAYPDEFDRIWEDICAERAAKADKAVHGTETVERPVKKKKLSWKKVAVLAIAATLTTASICFVAVGKKSYFYRENRRINGNQVFNNDSTVFYVDSLNEAYEMVSNELGIKPIKLGYIAAGMDFEEVRIIDGYAVIEFVYNEKKVQFIQAKKEKEDSISYSSDGVDYKTVHNKWLNKDLLIKSDKLDNGNTKYETVFVNEGAICYFIGEIEEKEFIQIISRMSY